MNYQDNIKVVSMRSGLSQELGWIDIKCDRSSVLGNPFELTSTTTRDAVVHIHKQWLNKVRLHNCDKLFPLDVWISQGFKIAPAFKYPTSFQVMKELHYIESLLRTGKKVRLLCWCKQPNKEVACHCDNYRAYLIWKLSS